METLIVSKTQTNHGASRCIGGIILENNRSVRLERVDGSYWPKDCDFEVGEIWNIEFNNRPGLTPPFVEDVLVTKREYLRDVDNIRRYLLARENQMQNFFWRGAVGSLYENKVDFQSSNGRAYIEVGNEPSMSTGFWVPSNDLILQQDSKHYNCGWHVIVYVGEYPPLPRIQSGTLCRVSLSRAIQPHPDVSSRYYVQLSCWYF